MESLPRCDWCSGHGVGHFSAEQICVYRIGAIGDLVCATPALFAIRRAYPEAHLTLLTTPGNSTRSRHAEELLGRAGWIDEIITYDLDEVSSLKDRIAFGKKLRTRKFDAVVRAYARSREVHAHASRHAPGASPRMFDGPSAGGFEHIGFAARAEAEMREFPDEVERLAAILRSCGIEGDATRFPPFASESAAALRVLLREDETDGRPIVAIAPGARRPCNLWPTDRFAAVCADLVGRGVAVFLIGSGEDYALCEQIRCESRATNLAGKLSLTGISATASSMRSPDLRRFGAAASRGGESEPDASRSSRSAIRAADGIRTAVSIGCSKARWNATPVCSRFALSTIDASSRSPSSRCLRRSTRSSTPSGRSSRGLRLAHTKWLSAKHYAFRFGHHRGVQSRDDAAALVWTASSSRRPGQWR